MSGQASYNFTIGINSTVDAFLTHLTVERRLATNSVDSYGRDLGALVQFAAGLGLAPEALSRQQLERHVRNMMADGRSPRSVARAVACYRGYYKYLLVDGRVGVSPAEEIRPPRMKIGRAHV